MVVDLVEKMVLPLGQSLLQLVAVEDLGGGVDGVMAQYITRPASAVIKVPPEAPQTYSELATLVCTGVTSWNALYGNKPLVPGQVVLVQG